MTKQKWLLVTLPIVIATLTVVFYHGDKPVTDIVPKQGQQIASSTEVLPTTPKTTNAPADAPQDWVGSTANSWISSQEVIAGQEASDKLAFRADSRGRIVTDEEARLNIEKLLALNDAGQLAGKQQVLEDSLPPTAARELADLIERFRGYQAAQGQVLPPGQELASAEDGLIQIDVLHGLRVQHFGPAVAEGFFGAEERLQRELLQLMRLEKDQSLTIEEKAVRAQTLYKSLPALAAAEERGKADAARMLP
jgi:hypothetical protein